MRLASTRPRTRRNYGVVENRYRPENVSATRTIVAAGLGAIMPAIAGWTIGAIAPGVSAAKLGTFGALLGASIGTYKSLHAQGAITED